MALQLLQEMEEKSLGFKHTVAAVLAMCKGLKRETGEGGSRAYGTTAASVGGGEDGKKCALECWESGAGGEVRVV